MSQPERASHPLHCGHRSRLKQCMHKNGFHAFSDYEQIEMLLTYCIPRKDVKPIAKELIRIYKNLKGILNAPKHNLLKIDGIGTSTVDFFYMLKSVSIIYESQSLYKGPLLNGSSKLEKLYRARIGGIKHEVFEIGFLDKSYRLIEDSVNRVEEGYTDYVNIYPGKIARMALDANAKGVVLAHNHPGGKAYPGQDDIQATQTIKKALKTLEIELVDHLIITDDDCFSFRSEQML
jgi:DNA repair protein RadC